MRLSGSQRSNYPFCICYVIRPFMGIASDAIFCAATVFNRSRCRLKTVTGIVSCNARAGNGQRLPQRGGSRRANASHSAPLIPHRPTPPNPHKCNPTSSHPIFALTQIYILWLAKHLAHHMETTPENTCFTNESGRLQGVNACAKPPKTCRKMLRSGMKWGRIPNTERNKRKAAEGRHGRRRRQADRHERLLPT